MPAVQKLRCVVERVASHDEHVYTVVLRPERPARFLAGQFLHLALDAYEPGAFWPESRVFSIASSPASRDTLAITYAVHGPYTARMERELSPGGQVWIKLPYGEFLIDGASDVVLFAGGTGITAFTAFLDQLPDDVSTQVVLAYGARSHALLIYRDVVAARAARVAALEAIYFSEDPQDAAAAGISPGRISVAAVWPRIRAPQLAQFYMAGPPMMIQVLRAQLADRGIAPEAIHVDAWE